jgi:hypothetical protein
MLYLFFDDYFCKWLKIMMRDLLGWMIEIGYFFCYENEFFGVWYFLILYYIWRLFLISML